MGWLTPSVPNLTHSVLIGPARTFEITLKATSFTFLLLPMIGPLLATPTALQNCPMANVGTFIVIVKHLVDPRHRGAGWIGQYERAHRNAAVVDVVRRTLFPGIGAIINSMLGVV